MRQKRTGKSHSVRRPRIDYITMSKAEGSMKSGGVQVVFVDEDGTYRVDGAALSRVTGEAAARGLPVCVVSVAGATRGGKSFLLDFFLRYLRAPDAARRCGAWIGADDEPLTGFSWRGGCDRDTSGIVIWPEPFIVQFGPKETSKQVAVVLMDTQGTFDSSSTVRDSSIIFAMSSLLSSVQIYNLSQHIKEDDLQYLHLFTEYGKLAQEESVESPFQVLQFLVRDWSCAYEYPFGSEGGMQLLDKKLEIKSEQAAELRELRQHVRSVFESIRCFLMPHPGLTVATSAAFRGCLKDITPEFKNALLEFVPSLFSPENITLKTILGQEITVQDLPQYFQNYIEIFNGDSLPSPVTVTKALSMASLEAALSAARGVYTLHMTESCGAARSVARAAVPRLHATAIRTATDTFTARRTLASSAIRNSRLETLTRELDANLHYYVAVNNDKIAASIANSKAAYRESLDAGTEKCLLPEELEELHLEGKVKALTVFDNSRTPDEEDEDDVKDRNALKQDLDTLLPLYREHNAANIERAAREAREHYEARLRADMYSARCLHPRTLQRTHLAAKAELLQIYDANWREEQSAMNEHRNALIDAIERIYSDTFVVENDTNNNCAIVDSLEHYKSIMEQHFESGKCVHPRHLVAENMDAMRATRRHFLAQRKQDPVSNPVDHYLQELQGRMTNNSFKFTKMNEDKNKLAVETALAEYNSIMVPIRVGGGVGAGVLELVGAPDFTIFRRHGAAKQQAITFFKRDLRIQGPQFDDDTHLLDLDKKINKAFTWLTLRVVGNVAAQGTSFALAAALMFFRR